MADNLYRIIVFEIKPAGLNPRPSTFISDFIPLIDRPAKGRDKMGQFEESFHGGHHTMPLLSFIMAHIPSFPHGVYISLKHMLSVDHPKFANCVTDCILLGTDYILKWPAT